MIYNPVFLFLLLASIVLFAARFTKGISPLSLDEGAFITISDDIKDVLVGIILGDAHIVKRSYTGNSRLVYAQTAVAHREYFNYVYSLYMPFCAKDYIPQSSIVRDNRTKKNLECYIFYNYATSLF